MNVHLTHMQELFPGTFQPTPGHYFIKLLQDKGLLQRCFTQNIDSLEHQAGLPKQEIVAAHGNFDSEFWPVNSAKRPCNIVAAYQGVSLCIFWKSAL